MRTIYSPTSNQTYIRIKPNESVIGILEKGGLFKKSNLGAQKKIVINQPSEDAATTPVASVAINDATTDVNAVQME